MGRFKEILDSQPISMLVANSQIISDIPSTPELNHFLRPLAGEGFIVDKFDALLQDFDTVMNGYTKLGMQVEELDKIVNKKVKASIATVQKENERLKTDVQYVMDRLIILETNQNKLQQRILILEEKERANFLELENIIIELDKKAERSDSSLENKKFLNALQEKIVVLNETTSADLESMKNFLKNFASKLQEDLDQKISGFEMDIRLEPLAGRLKKQEKLLKEIFLKIRVLECQSMGPIEVKRYAHCEDGKRVKPLQKQMTQWNQSQLSFFGSDKLLEENIADQIEADVEKRLEEAIFRDSKYYLKGLNLQAKATKT
ncbi:uncharacterized protein TNIN_260251 [Trichonephila inaurata madagascariensis]|uniref:Uncharacterized protein n=1 Tax=Trichonephila inaurata madagascariensis TaxID=2747483 RepID=A0A8X6MG04_9ARAC|nr:uncharacterized protein TNIN_260251 [Trichonephila inaurata madagascariensis]